MNDYMRALHQRFFREPAYTGVWEEIERVRRMGAKPAARRRKKQTARTMTDFQAQPGTRRRPGTGCVTQINDHLWEGRYSPKWPDGKKHPRNIYAHSPAECEEKLAAMIREVQEEMAAAKAAMGA